MVEDLDLIVKVPKIWKEQMAAVRLNKLNHYKVSMPLCYHWNACDGDLEQRFIQEGTIVLEIVLFVHSLGGRYYLANHQ